MYEHNLMLQGVEHLMIDSPATLTALSDCLQIDSFKLISILTTKYIVSLFSKLIWSHTFQLSQSCFVSDLVIIIVRK